MELVIIKTPGAEKRKSSLPFYYHYYKLNYI